MIVESCLTNFPQTIQELFVKNHQKLLLKMIKIKATDIQKYFCCSITVSKQIVNNANVTDGSRFVHNFFGFCENKNRGLCFFAPIQNKVLSALLLHLHCFVVHSLLCNPSLPFQRWSQCFVRFEVIYFFTFRMPWFRFQIFPLVFQPSY